MTCSETTSPSSIMASNDPPRFLLLLPPAPLPLSPSSLRTAYGETLSQVLKEVATHSSDSTKAAVLEIALACPHLVDASQTPRSKLYDQTQKLLAGLYSLICTVAAKDGVNVEDEDGVDVRVLTVAFESGAAQEGSKSGEFGPVISLTTLARSGRTWQYAFGVESEDGEAMVKAFVAAKRAQDDTRPASEKTSQPANSKALHNHVAVGGTFDHIHIGHKLLLTMTIFAVDEASSSSPRVATIGITGDQLLTKKKHAEVLESWEDRYRSVMSFVDAIVDFSSPSSSGQRHVSVRDDPGPNGKSMDVAYPNGLEVRCTEIQDPFGPTITEEGISALIISAETRAGGKAVNDKREEKGWKALEVFEVDVLDAEEGDVEGETKVKQGFESKLSSTAIREKLARKREKSSL
jgi:phosphopantetheine adenylyltransferase